jgi:hypothetical protein
LAGGRSARRGPGQPGARRLDPQYDRELGAIDGIGLTDVEMDSVLMLVLD